MIRKEQLCIKGHLAAAGAFSSGSANAERPPREENRCNKHPNSVLFLPSDLLRDVSPNRKTEGKEHGASEKPLSQQQRLVVRGISGCVNLNSPARAAMDRATV